MLLEKVNSDQPMTRDELRQILREIKDRLWREDTNEAFASKLCATGGAASFLVRKSVINSTWLHCVDTLLYLAPNYATQLVNAGIYTLLLGFGSEHTGAKSLREGSRHILDQLFTNPDGLDLGKIVATPGVVPFVAKESRTTGATQYQSSRSSTMPRRHGHGCSSRRISHVAGTGEIGAKTARATPSIPMQLSQTLSTIPFVTGPSTKASSQASRMPTLSTGPR